MFCPNCGQERISEATKFCARCGYLLTGTEELLRRGGVLDDESPVGPRLPSAKARGVKMGIFMMLTAVVLVPLMGILFRFAIGMPNPWPIGVVLFLLGGGGLLRMAYAILFEAGAAETLSAGVNRFQNRRELGGRSEDAAALPPQHSYPATDYTSPGTGRWRDTKGLEPLSVTDSTTKLLEKDSE